MIRDVRMYQHTLAQNARRRGPARDPHWFVMSRLCRLEHLKLLYKPFQAYRNIPVTLWADFQKIDFFMISHENHDFQEFHPPRGQNIEFHNFVLKALK